MKSYRLMRISVVSALMLFSVSCAMPAKKPTHAQSQPPAKETASEYINSSVITTKVKTALLAYKEINAENIHVTTVREKVILSGYVDSAADKIKADVIAHKIKGVGSVTNNLKIK